MDLKNEEPSEKIESQAGHQEISLAASGPSEKKMKLHDFTEFDNLVDELADELKLARHPDPSIVIKAARLMLERSISFAPHSRDDEVMDTIGGSRETKELGKQPDNEKPKSNAAHDRTIQLPKLALVDVPLPKTLTSESGHKTGETPQSSNLSCISVSAFRGLKLLYLDDQRQLQDQVNELITSIQAITANPKTRLTQ